MYYNYINHIHIQFTNEPQDQVITSLSFLFVLSQLSSRKKMIIQVITSISTYINTKMSVC